MTYNVLGGTLNLAQQRSTVHCGGVSVEVYGIGIVSFHFAVFGSFF